jgi:hypothetical protein
MLCAGVVGVVGTGLLFPQAVAASAATSRKAKRVFTADIEM